MMASNDGTNNCDNCHRLGVVVSAVQWDSVRRKCRMKFYNIIRQGRHLEVKLCHHCRSYLFSGTRASKAQQYYWPAMIWKFLTHSRIHEATVVLSPLEKWRLLPIEWRQWWIDAFQLEFPTVRNALCHEDASFTLVTDDLNEVNEAIRTLRWKDLGEMIDKFLGFPTVRCPWGCAEFLSRVRTLPFEEFLYQISNGSFECYGGTQGNENNWTSSIRPDFPSSVSILESDILCRPSLIVDDLDGICILCCEKHSKSSRGRYLHVPQSPTGILYTEHSNQYAQAVIRSRTL